MTETLSQTTLVHCVKSSFPRHGAKPTRQCQCPERTRHRAKQPTHTGVKPNCWCPAAPSQTDSAHDVIKLNRWITTRRSQAVNAHDTKPNRKRPRHQTKPLAIKTRSQAVSKQGAKPKQVLMTVTPNQTAGVRCIKSIRWCPTASSQADRSYDVEPTSRCPRH